MPIHKKSKPDQKDKRNSNGPTKNYKQCYGSFGRDVFKESTPFPFSVSSPVMPIGKKQTRHYRNANEPY
jgi:hypothetical protein